MPGRRLDFLVGGFMLALAGVIVAATGSLSVWDGAMPGSRFMPLCLAGVSALLALALFLEARTSSAATMASWPDATGFRRVLMVLALVFGFVLLAPWFGFVVVSAVFILAMLLGVERRRLAPSLLAAAITASLIHTIFVWWLRVPLPKGVLGI